MAFLGGCKICVEKDKRLAEMEKRLAEMAEIVKVKEDDVIG